MRLEYFELLDTVEEIDLDGGTIRVSSTLPEVSPVFEGHFPAFPILPGVFMLEIMNHAAGFLLYKRYQQKRFVFLGGVKRAKFRRMVKPGARHGRGAACCRRLVAHLPCRSQNALRFCNARPRLGAPLRYRHEDDADRQLRTDGSHLTA